LARIVLSREVRARVETALIGITEDALRGRIRRVMLRAARTDQWKQCQGWTPCARGGPLAPAAAPWPRPQRPPPNLLRPRPPLSAICAAPALARDDRGTRRGL